MVKKSLPSGVVVLMFCSSTSSATLFFSSSDAISRRSRDDRLAATEMQEQLVSTLGANAFSFGLRLVWFAIERR